MCVEVPNYLDSISDVRICGRKADEIRALLLQNIKERHLTKDLYRPYHYVRRFGPRIKEITELSIALKMEDSLNDLYSKIDYVVIPRTNGLKTKIVKKIDKDLAYLFGVICGDGSLSKNNYQLAITLSKKEEGYARHLCKLISTYFGIKLPSIIELDRFIGIYVRNKVIHTFLTKIVGLPSGKRTNFGIPEIIKKDQDLVKEFIGGFFDTDGTVYIKHGRKIPYIRIFQKDKQILVEIKEFLSQFGIKTVFEYGRGSYKKNSIVYHLVIYGKYSVLTFCKLINSRHEYKSKVLGKFALAPIGQLG